MMKDFFFAIGDAFEKFFSIMPFLGNTPNYLAIFIISILFLYWTIKLIKYQKNENA